MRYRRLSASGDYTFGQSQANFLINTPQCVAQAVQTALALMQGEWFLNTTVGTPYGTQILGFGTTGTYDNAIRAVISGVQNVTQIISYTSNLDSVTRILSVECEIDTAFGPVAFSSVIGQPTQPPIPLKFAGSPLGDTAVFTWLPVPGTTYNLYRGDVSGGIGALPIATGLTDGYAVVPNVPGHIFYYQLRAVVNGVVSEPTYEVEINGMLVGELKFNFARNSTWAALTANSY